MKKITLLFALLLSLGAVAQNGGDLVIFNNSGYKFHVILNGVKQNAVAESNVRVQGLTNSWYSCHIIADDNTFSLEKNIMIKQDSVFTYQIVNKKGKFKLRYFSESPMAKSPETAEQTLITYHATDIPPNPEPVTTTTTVTQTETVSTQTTTSGSGAGVQTNVSVSESGTTPTTVQTSAGANGVGGSEQVSISMEAGENGIKMDVSATGMEGSENVSVNMTGTGGETDFEQNSTTTHSESVNGTTTYTETTTVTTTTSGNFESTSTGMETSTNVNSGTTRDNDVMDCYISESDADEAIAQISEEAFADDQLGLANTLARTKCLNVEQIGKIADILTFSEDKMSFVKTAHTLCLNRSDYYKLVEKFEFSEDKEELRKFIEENK